MTAAHPQNLKPRKTPRQARAETTVDAILEATIQVLLSEGARRLTTTRVAARAGVSVGPMYQYFPHKAALNRPGQSLRQTEKTDWPSPPQSPGASIVHGQATGSRQEGAAWLIRSGRST